MTFSISTDFIAAGGNRHPSAADWDSGGSGLLAFGANNNVALWKVKDAARKGIIALLPGHTETVNSLKFLRTKATPDQLLLLTGSADKTIRIWCQNGNGAFEQVKTLTDHTGSINSISVLPEENFFVSGSADGTVKFWKITVDGVAAVSVELLQDITLAPRYFPLAVDLIKLDSSSSLLAVGGTKSFIQVFVTAGDRFELAATLTGHEGWIRSLSFTRETEQETSDIILSSASQDKYIRLWRIHQGEDLPNPAAAVESMLGSVGKSLSNKAHRFSTDVSKYSVTFEALLLGHEDWIYSTSWCRTGGTLQLLSASADNSLAMWQSDPASSVWVCMTRLGEISSQKGSTTATGSTGGFWVGLWSPDGDAVVSLGRTGGWRLWKQSNTDASVWSQDVAISGHLKEVKDICWATDSSYLLSTSSDQTTRLFAEWNNPETSSWHEFSRPQIHGYDLNCVKSITASRFVSGADEKLLRVFDEPNTVASLLDRLCDIKTTERSLPDAANIPVLGLSNKAIQALDDNEATTNVNDDEQDPIDPASFIHKSTVQFNHPPFEDHLSRHLLWPEAEKLYGHGYEISSVATSHDGSLVASACKASSIEHAVIRVYETREWREIKPPLTAHSLTVTGLEFSPDDKYLLSVGRDRQWAIFHRSSEAQNTFVPLVSDPKGHSRMILDVSWGPLEAGRIFATAGRDKQVKIWQMDSESKSVECKTTVPATAAVTAVSFYPRTFEDSLLFAYGTEEGSITVVKANTSDLTIVSTTNLDKAITPSRAINELAWRLSSEAFEKGLQLAVASEDYSVRVYRVSNLR